jgi:hypothetical protein
MSDLARYLWNALLDPVPDQAVKRAGELDWNRAGDQVTAGYGDVIRKPRGRAVTVNVGGRTYQLPPNDEMNTFVAPPGAPPDPLKGLPIVSGGVNWSRR